jgi:DNA-directed RNA polymerase specialized sigma subunit
LKGTAMQEIKKILMMMNSELFYKILKISNLTDTEYKLLQEFILRETPRDEVCSMLNISRSTFQTIKEQAFLKIKISMTALLDERIKQMQ